MGRLAAARSDVVFVTDDNPRREDPARIRRDLLRGSPAAVEIPRRSDAIRAAIECARAGDVVLLAGKGEESVMIVGTGEIAHDDREVARAAIAAAGGELRSPHPIPPDDAPGSDPSPEATPERAHASDRPA